MLKYKIAPGFAFTTYHDFADAIGLPMDGSIPAELRVRVEDYLAPPLEPDKEVHASSTTIEDEL